MEDEQKTEAISESMYQAHVEESKYEESKYEESQLKEEEAWWYNEWIVELFIQYILQNTESSCSTGLSGSAALQVNIVRIKNIRW